MHNGLSSRIWRWSSLVAALAVFGVLAALPAVPAAAHGSAHDEPYFLALDCQLGSIVDYTKSCVFDLNGDGVADWWITDTDGDGIYDTSSLDTDFDGREETFYFITPYGDVSMHYNHDGDGLYDEEEIYLYYTDPYNWDTDGDGYGDSWEIADGSDPLNPWCTPYGCG